MLIIEINSLENGSHRNQNINIEGTELSVPDGWAVIPDGMSIPETFPFVNIVVDGQMVVGIEERPVPDVPEPIPTPSQLDRVEAQVTYTAMMTDTLLPQSEV